MPENMPELSVLFGQPDLYSTSFQTMRLAAALEPWFKLKLIRVPASNSKFGRSFNRFKTNYLKPFFTRPKTDFLLYGNDGAANLAHWRAQRLIYWYDAPRDWSASPPARSEWIQWLRYQNIRRAEHVFAVSAAQVRVAKALRPGREASVHYLPVGVDCRVFDPNAANPQSIRAQYSLPQKPIVGYLGYLGSYQGRFAGEMLLDAAPAVLSACDAHFFIVGFGPALDLWKAKVEKLGLANRFTFTGRVEDAQLPPCLAAMDICVDTLEPGFHSLARSETKLKQYMAMGRACAATAIGENVIDLDSGNCGLLAGPTPKLLARAIIELANNTPLREKLGAAARERACTVYDWNVLAKKLKDTLNLQPAL